MRDAQCTLWKLQKFNLTEKKFSQINYLGISLVKTLLSRNFCQKCVRLEYSIFNCGNYLEVHMEKYVIPQNWN